ncbi:hypothetical protein KIPB_007785, partial [Kipferlia bialata]|eukprot:g7785.t1
MSSPGSDPDYGMEGVEGVDADTPHSSILAARLRSQINRSTHRKISGPRVSLLTSFDAEGSIEPIHSDGITSLCVCDVPQMPSHSCILSGSVDSTVQGWALTADDTLHTLDPRPCTTASHIGGVSLGSPVVSLQPTSDPSAVLAALGDGRLSLVTTTQECEEGGGVRMVARDLGRLAQRPTCLSTHVPTHSTPHSPYQITTAVCSGSSLHLIPGHAFSEGLDLAPYAVSLPSTIGTPKACVCLGEHTVAVGGSGGRVA